MTDPQDRAITLTFSVRLSQLPKLEQLMLITGKNRSQLLEEWLNEKFSAHENSSGVSRVASTSQVSSS